MYPQASVHHYVPTSLSSLICTHKPQFTDIDIGGRFGQSKTADMIKSEFGIKIEDLAMDEIS